MKLGKPDYARKFLATVSGVARAKTGNSADKANRIAVIDPAYVSGSARVTFDGETTMSGKAYPVLGNYRPRAGERVQLVPSGTTYVIIGPLGNVVGDALTMKDNGDTVDQSFSSTTAARYQAIGFTFIAPPSGSGKLILTADLSSPLEVNDGFAWGEIRAGGTLGTGTVAFDGNQEGYMMVMRGNVTVSVRNTQSAVNIVFGLTPGSTYNATLWFRKNSAGAGVYTMRAGRVGWDPK